MYYFCALIWSILQTIGLFWQTLLLDLKIENTEQSVRLAHATAHKINNYKQLHIGRGTYRAVAYGRIVGGNLIHVGEVNIIAAIFLEKARSDCIARGLYARKWTCLATKAVRRGSKNVARATQNWLLVIYFVMLPWRGLKKWVFGR